MAYHKCGKYPTTEQDNLDAKGWSEVGGPVGLSGANTDQTNTKPMATDA